MELSTTALSKIFSVTNEHLIPALAESGRLSGKEMEIVRNMKLPSIRSTSEPDLLLFVSSLMKLSKTFMGHKTSFDEEAQVQKLVMDEIKDRFLNLSAKEIYQFCKMGMSGEFDGETEKINTFSPANFVRWGKAYVELKSPVVQKCLIEERKLEKQVEENNKLTKEQENQRMKEIVLKDLESLKSNPEFKFADLGNAKFNFLIELGIEFNKSTKKRFWNEAVVYYKLNGKIIFDKEIRDYESFVKWCEKKGELKLPNYFYTLSLSLSKQNTLLDYFKEVLEMGFDLQSLIESLLEEKNLPNENSL